jgi:CRP/FNR family transcriptional regulator, cyclic AMP receptor protein
MCVQPSPNQEARGLLKYSDVQDQLASALQRWELPDEFIARLAASCHPVTFEKESLLFAKGLPADLMFFVLDGVVRMYVTEPAGDRCTFMLAGRGDFLGFASTPYDRGAVHCFDASALSKCLIALFSRRYIFQLLNTLTPPALIKLIENMNTAWSRALEWHMHFFGLSAGERLVLMLHELGEKFGVPAPDGVLIDIRLTHDDFAELIGCSRPVIGKIFNEITSAGRIQFGNRGGILLRSST